MPVRAHDDANAFLAAARPLLESDPFSTNVIAVAAQMTAAKPTPSSDRLWLTAEDDHGTVLGAAMHTPPFPPFLSRMPGETAAELATALANGGHQLPGVNGASESTGAFQEAWTELTGATSKVIRSFRMYRLDELTPPRGVPGTATIAAPQHAELLAGWFTAFHREALPHDPQQDQAGIVQQRVAAGQIQLWHDAGAPVSVAAISDAAVGVVRVGPVYTPPAARRNGYGTAVTAAASANAIARGAEHVVLYADSANPTANSIYRAIGFRPDHDADSRLFEPA